MPSTDIDVLERAGTENHVAVRQLRLHAKLAINARDQFNSSILGFRTGLLKIVPIHHPAPDPENHASRNRHLEESLDVFQRGMVPAPQ